MYRFVSENVFLSLWDEDLSEIGTRHAVELSPTRLSSLNLPFIENVKEIEMGPFDRDVEIIYFGISKGETEPPELKRIPKGISVSLGKTLSYPPGYFRLYLETF